MLSRLIPISDSIKILIRRIKGAPQGYRAGLFLALSFSAGLVVKTYATFHPSPEDETRVAPNDSTVYVSSGEDSLAGSMPTASPQKYPRLLLIPHGISINRATTEELERLPGVGHSLASEIIAYRADHPFTSIEQLMHVRGIGRKKLDRIDKYITL